MPRNPYSEYSSNLRNADASLRNDPAARRDIVRAQRRKITFSLLLVFVVAIATWPFVHAHLQAAAVLNLVAGKPVPAVLRPFVSAPITTTDITLPGSDGTLIQARLYAPIAHPLAPAIVVLHGVHHLGMNEPRLVAFAQALAGCGLRVLTPELPDIADFHVSPADIHTIGDSAAWLSVQNPQHAFHPVGLMGLSFAGGLSLLAAADPAYHSSIKFVVAIGSQDEMSRVAEYYRTGVDAKPTGTPTTLPPHEYGALVLEYANLQDFVPAEDIVPLRALLKAHLYEDGPAEQAARGALTPAQDIEADRLLNAQSPITRALLADDEARQ